MLQRKLHSLISLFPSLLSPMLSMLLGVLATAAMSFLDPQKLLATAQECPLDLSWPDFTLAASACSSLNERPKCCRYMNAFIAVSISRYAKTTGTLGVPASLIDICLNYVSETLNSYGIPPNATIFCGLGTKILVSYQCQGRATILDMLQSPNFDDVIRNCKMPLSSESSCRRCLTSDILYLHHLIGAQDNITLSTCRDAAFVALENQGDNFSAIDFASCFFSIKEIIIPPVNTSEPPSLLLPPALAPAPSPSTLSSQAPAEHLIAVTVKQDHHQRHFRLISGIGIAVIGLAIILLVILSLLIRNKGRELKSVGSPVEPRPHISPHPEVLKSQEGQIIAFRRFGYKEIKKATGNFRNTIGKGGFATVYKAKFDDGSIGAVKQMKRFLAHGEEEFYREMELIGRLHHRHLVALRGFCLDRHERFLIYEYMENGSLKDHLHSPDRVPLAWHARIQIAIDVANALEYLHFYCNPPLFHNDIKSSNILLDGKFLAKVADFGLTHASSNSELLNTVIQVTPGYIDPEFVVTQKLTEKSDVYSYGVLLLELITGRHTIHNNTNLVEWSQEFMESDSKLHELVDPVISNSFDPEQLQVLVRIIEWCTEREGTSRPSIKQVLRLLYERLDPLHSSFLMAIEDEEGVYGVGRTSKRKSNGDARYLHSSSSTSRSYCSRSVLLEISPPHSPTGNFSC